MRAPVIVRVFKNNQLLDVKQFEQDQIVFGHDADVSVELNDSQVSLIHCLIERRDTGYYICDMGSQTGTFLNGKQILDESIKTGDEVQVGPFKIVFFAGVIKPKATDVAQTQVSEQSTKKIQTSSAPSKTYEPEPVPVKVAPNIPEAPKSTNKFYDASQDTTKTKPAPTLHSKPDLTIKHSKKTFAPASQIPDLKKYVKPTKGQAIEVMTAWKDRILSTQQFSGRKSIVAGISSHVDMQIAHKSFYKPVMLVIPDAVGCRVAIPKGFSVSLINQENELSEEALNSLSRIMRSGTNQYIKLEQNEVVVLESETLTLFVRFVPSAKIAPVGPVLDLTSGEVTSVVVTVLLVTIFSFYLAITKPKMTPPPEEEVQRVATVIFNKPPAEPKPEPTPPPLIAAPTPTPPPKRVVVTDEDKNRKATTKSNTPNNTERPKQTAATRANEVRPIPSKVNRPKSFTSIKQGGAVKTGDKAGANAQSANKDLSKIGLFSAFGGGGTRQQLDQAYSGTGEVLGMAEKATGTSGFSEDRAGDDLGSKFKDTGSGGKGTATQGIAGIGTKGRGSGTSAYGSGDGLGGKDAVTVDGGGFEEEFVGSIDKEAVRRVVRAGLREVRSCYEKELNRNPGIEGKVIIEWDIGEQGKVLTAKVKSTSLGNANVENCIVARLRTWRFPEPPSNLVATVSYPFLLKSNR